MVLMAGCANLDPPAKDALYQQAMAGTQVPAQWVASAQTAAFAPQWAGFPEHGTLQSLIDEALGNNLTCALPQAGCSKRRTKPDWRALTYCPPLAWAPERQRTPRLAAPFRPMAMPS